MIRRYSQMHRTYKYSQHSWIIWPIWLNCCVFVYEISGCGFESCCNHLNLRFCAFFEKGVPWHSANYRVWIHSEMRTWNDMNIQFKAPFRWILTTQLNHLANLDKWLSVRLWTKWLWVRVLLQSLKLQISGLNWARSFLTFQGTIKCGSTLKCIRDMIRTYNQIHGTDRSSHDSAIILPIWLNGWVLAYELTGCWF